ncbi:MAG TPA: YfcE family phosphodiesterase [Phycisphaerae bacterium]|nr:YfcE family phosphodiesterase [Phycisphaerae bacterium]
MLIALLSDTHDNAATTRAAIELLRPHNPDAYLHAGDLVSPEMLDLFAGLNAPFHLVLGNNEYDPAALHSRASALGMSFHKQFADLTFAGKRLALMHGHEGTLLQRLLASGDYDYLIHGHTHLRRDERRGRTRIINPGALHRARTKSVALLDPAADSLRFLDMAQP